MGRLPEYDKAATMDMICDLLANGKTLRAICSSVDGMPQISTVMQWIADDDKLAEQYARARQKQADFYADEIIDISDTEPDPQVARVRIDARKWHASKTAPKKYGDKIHTEHSGTVNVHSLTDEELIALAEGGN